MGINISISSGATMGELDAIMALITTLRACNDYKCTTATTVEPRKEEPASIAAEAPGESLSATPNGEASLPSTSVMVPPAPVAALPETEIVMLGMGGNEIDRVTVPLPPVAVPTPPVPPAPVAVVPPPPASNGAAVALDADGLPWDARIHSANKQFIANGTWRRRKNTPDEQWEAVRAELRQTMGATGVPADSATIHSPPDTLLPSAEAVAGWGVEPAVIDAASAFAPVTVPLPPTAAVPTPPAPMASGPVVATSAADLVMPLLLRITGEQAAGTVSVEQVQAAAVSVGLPNIRELMKRPDLVGAVETALFGAVAA